MTTLHTFLRKLRHTALRSRVANVSPPQQASIRRSNVIPLRAKTVRHKPQSSDFCPPSDSDYEAANRLRDPEYGYEFQMWRLW